MRWFASGSGPAELVVADARRRRAGTRTARRPGSAAGRGDRCRRPAGRSCRPSGPTRTHAAVVVAAEDGHGRVRPVRHVVLERAAAVQRLLVDQRRPVPVEAVEPVAAQRHRVAGRVVGRLRRLAPVEVDRAVVAEVLVERDAEQAALGVRVDRQVEHDRRRTPSLTRLTCPVGFSSTKKSFSPMNSICTGWLSPLDHRLTSQASDRPRSVGGVCASPPLRERQGRGSREPDGEAHRFHPHLRLCFVTPHVAPTHELARRFDRITGDVGKANEDRRDARPRDRCRRHARPAGCSRARLRTAELLSRLPRRPAAARRRGARSGHRAGRPLGLLFDLQGPKLRLSGDVETADGRGR